MNTSLSSNLLTNSFCLSSPMVYANMHELFYDGMENDQQLSLSEVLYNKISLTKSRAESRLLNY